VNKTSKVLITVICLLVISTLGFVNATPRTLKQVNLLYSTSTNSATEPTTPWMPVPGNQVSDFKLTLDGSAVTWYYLNIKFIKPTLPEGIYGFWLTPPPETDLAFWDYWIDRGVTNSANHATWQWIMFTILKGVRPMFSLHSFGDGSYMLVDGLQWFASGMTLEKPLRLNGDYPKGTYTFTCRASTVADSELLGTVMNIVFR